MFPSLPLAAQTLFKRSQAGIFAGKLKRFGNNVPNSKHKTPRTWLPNIQTKHFYLDSLRQQVKLRITARALRTIDKYGGLEPYLMGVKDTELGYEGMRLRLAIKDARRGLPPSL